MDGLTRGRVTARLMPSILLAIAIGIAYSNAWSGQFLFDDVASIVDNSSIRSIWPLSHSFSGPRDTPTAGRPLVNFSFALNYAAGKLDVTGYHAVNLFLHWINATLLFALVQATLLTIHSPLRSRHPRPSTVAAGDGTITQGKAGSDSRLFEFLRQNATGMAITVALLWSLHPIQTETVSYVTQRTELMMACCLLMTLLAAKKSWDTKSASARGRWFCVATVACGLGMACKEVMVVAPVMVILYDLAFVRAPLKAILKQRWPLYASLAATWVILIVLLASNPRGRSAGLGVDIRPTDYLAMQFWAIVQYMWLALVPVQLVGDYGEFKPISIRAWFPRLMVLAIPVVLTVWAWFRQPPLSFLGCWFFIILAPTSSIVPIATEPIAERRIYLSLAAVMVLMALAAVQLATWRPDAYDPSAGTWRWVYRRWLVASVILLAIVYGLATYARNRVYQDELAFWTDVTQKLPTNSRGFTHLGMTYAGRNQPERRW